MTELINNQKITPNELNRRAEILSSDDDMDPTSNRIMSDMGIGHQINQRQSSEYVNTDDEGAKDEY